MVAFSVVFVLMDVHLKGLMRLVVLECVGRKRTEEGCGFGKKFVLPGVKH